MTVGRCRVLGIEGAPASGKTTLVHALVAHYRARGIHATDAPEAARSSPYIEDAVVRGGRFDAVVELDVLGAQLSTQLRSARHHQLLITDGTLIGTLAYASHFLSPEERAVTDAVAALAAATMFVYDAVFLLSDVFDLAREDDVLRRRMTGLQRPLSVRLADIATQYGPKVVAVPAGRALDARTRWISQRVARLGLDSWQRAEGGTI